MSKKKTKKDKERNLDIRPEPIFCKNYDYGGSEEGDGEVSPGRGLYNGKMDKYPSIADFIQQSRERMRKKRKELLAYLYYSIIK